MDGRDGSLTERVMTRPRSTGTTLGLLVLAAGLLFGSHVRAEEEAAKSEESTEELTKKTQNPVADLISVPFQSNFNFGAGPRHALLYVLNVQPVVPIKLTEDWNLITRTIVPIISQGSLAPGIDHVGATRRHQPEPLPVAFEAREGPWVYGALASNQWSFAGWG